MIEIKYNKYIPLVLFVLLLGLSILILKPFILVIVMAAILAYMVYPLRKKLGNKMSSTWAAFIVTLLVFLIILIPLIFFTQSLVKESLAIYALGKQKISTGFFENCNGELCVQLGDFIQDPRVTFYFQNSLKLVTDLIVEKGSALLASVPGFLLGFFVMFFSLFYFLKDGKSLFERTVDFISMKRKDMQHIVKRLKEAINAVIFGQLIVAFIQGMLGALAFFVVGIYSPLFWGLIMAFLALIPYLGTTLIWGPASMWLLLEGVFTDSRILIFKGMGLFIAGLVISSIDNFLKPKLISGRGNIHPLLVLLGILGGLYLMGIIGVVLGPLILVLTATLINMYLGESSRTGVKKKAKRKVESDIKDKVKDKFKKELEKKLFKKIWRK